MKKIKLNIRVTPEIIKKLKLVKEHGLTKEKFCCHAIEKELVVFFKEHPEIEQKETLT